MADLGVLAPLLGGPGEPGSRARERGWWIGAFTPGAGADTRVVFCYLDGRRAEVILRRAELEPETVVQIAEGIRDGRRRNPGRPR